MKKRLIISLLLIICSVMGYSESIERIEAETFDEASGAKAETNSDLSGTGNVGYIKNGTWIKFSGVNFSENDTRFDVSASSAYDGGNVEFRLDAADGTLIGTAVVSGTSGWTDYQVVSSDIAQTSGTHDLYLVFTGGDGYLFNLDYFEKVTSDPGATIYTLSTNVSPESSGTVALSMPGSEFEEGTEIALTADPNADYSFVHWVDGNGTVISANNPVTFSISSDTTFVAEFEATVGNTPSTVTRFEGETFDEASGARAESNSNLSGTGNVGYITNGTWIKFSGLEFNEYDTRFDVAASGTAGGNIEFRLDAADGTLIGTAVMSGTTGWGDYQIFSTTIAKTSGTHDLFLVFTGGDGYLFNLDYFEKVTSDPNAINYTLSTNVTPALSGSVFSSMSGSQFEEGTEITLTAKDNFGYDFVRWVDGNGTVISTNNPITFSITSDTTLISEFEAVNTYTLTVNTEGAFGLGKFNITPTGKDGGVSEYEEGTLVTIAAVENDIVKFSNWSNGSTELSTSVTMDQDANLTGTFDNVTFIAGWTFEEDRYAHPRGAELYSNVENRPDLFAYHVSDNTLAANVRTNERGGEQGFCVWNSDRGEFFYFMTSFSTVGYKNITVTSGLIGYYYGCDEWTLQYSLDGVTFSDLSALTTINTSSITPVGGTLPIEAEGKEKIYLRWYPNVNGTKHGDPSDVTATLLSKVSIKADEVQVADEVAPVLQSIIPAEGSTSASASGSIILNYDEKVQGGTGEATLNGKSLAAEFVNKTVKYSYYGLEYNKQYTFNLPAGAVTDLSGNDAEAIELTFRTIEKPVPTKRLFDLIVDADATDEQIASGNYVRTIAEAFSAAPANSSERFLVLIANGTYNLGGDGNSPQGNVLTLNSGKNNVSLVAQSKDGVILQGNPAQGIKNAVLSIEANDLYMENITIEHVDGVVNSGQKPALNPAGDRNVYNGIRLRSKQDTQVTGGTRSFYYKSTIEGDVDFICGGGTHWFEGCKLVVVGAGYIVAPAHDASLQYGYVFNNDTITAVTQYYLGRPWQNSPRAVYLNTIMLDEPRSEGWTSMGTLPAIFAEYNSVNGSGVAVNTDNRTNVFTVNNVAQTGSYNPVLTQEEAAEYTIENVLGGTDKWNPLLAVEQLGAPSNLSAGLDSTLRWDPNQNAICYVVCKDNKLLAITTDTAYVDSTANVGTHTYSVQAASEYGGLSPISSVDLTIEGDNVVSPISYYNAINGELITSLNPVEYTEGTALALPSPILGGYTFFGWSTSATEANTLTEISSSAKGDQVFYAFWGDEGDNQPDDVTQTDYDYVFTAAENKSWDNAANFNPVGQPAVGDQVSCNIEIETTSNAFPADLTFLTGGTLRLRGSHSATGKLIFKEGTSIYYYTSGQGMSLDAPMVIDGSVECNMMSSTEGETVMTFGGSISGNGNVAPVNVGRGEIVNTGVLILDGDNTGFTGTWDLTRKSSNYPDMGYQTAIEGNSANAFGSGIINVDQDNYAIFNHQRAAGSDLNLNIAGNGKAVLNTIVNVQKLTINGTEYGEGIYDRTTNPEYFEGNGRIEVTSEYAGGEEQTVPAFPGAEGFGKYVTGGRGGKVTYVTNLNDNGPGSLRDAVEQSGPRIVVFKVSGTIKLESELSIGDNITIAGQSAPGGGITLRDYDVKVRGNNVIIRFIRFRMGDAQNVEDDALGGRFQENIIVDHCSMSWSTDECVSFYENKNFTLQWCIISESLTNSVHAKGAHGYGGIWGGLKASFHHNLLSHHSSRTPRFGEYAGRTVPLEGLVDMRNNVIYNWNGEGCYGGDAMNVNMVNNYYKPGPATEDKRKERIVSTGRNMDETSPLYDIWGRFYIDGNVVVGSERATNDNWTYGVFNQFHSSQGEVTDEDKSELRMDEPHDCGEITTHSAEKAYELVLDFAGASVYRDAVDLRAVDDTREGKATIMNGGNGSTNGFIDTPSAAGGWPELPTAEAPVDTDEDGMPDDWEIANGLDPANPIDCILTTLDGQYTNVEVYLNSLVNYITENQNGNLDVYVTPEDFVEKYADAEDGTRFIMADGTYAVGETAITKHNYRFVADKGAEPVFAGYFSTENNEISDGSLSFDGIDIDLTDGNPNFIQLKNGAALSNFELSNSSVKGVQQSLYVTEGQTDHPIAKIVLDNCIVDGTAANGAGFIQPDARIVNLVSITNSTIFNYSGGNNFVLLQNSDATDQSIEVKVENNTIYNVGNQSGNGFVRLDNAYIEASTYNFKDNIVQDRRSIEGDVFLFCSNNPNGAGNAVLDNNLIVGAKAQSVGGAIAVVETNAVELGDLGLIDLAFPNPSEGDFSFSKNSPLATASSDGGVLGDPRWLKEDAIISSITYINSVDGQELTNLLPSEYIEGTIQVLPVPTLEGYTFFGWSTSDATPALLQEISSDATGNQVFYAFWGDNGNNQPDNVPLVTYSISYLNMPNGAVNPNVTEVEVGTSYTLEEARCGGYRFLGWYLDDGYNSEVSEFASSHEEDVTVYGRWKQLGEFYAFPTIAKNSVALVSSEPNDIVTIVNENGFVVKQINMTNQTIQIDVNDLATGSYIIKSTNTGMVTRIIVQ